MRLSLQIAWLVGAVGGLAVPALADGSSAAPGPTLTESLSSGVYALRGSFDVDVGPHTVWQVLTDYDALPHFVHSILKSVAEKPSGGRFFVTQEFQGKALIFTRDMQVRLDVHEQPERRINFTDIERKDFDVYRGYWRLQKTPTGSRVVYRLWAKPHGLAPASIARGEFKNAALLMLSELRAEIVRRGAKQPLTRAEEEPKAKKGGAP